MVTEMVQGRAPWLLRGTGKDAMVTEMVEGRAQWLLRGHEEGCHGN